MHARADHRNGAAVAVVGRIDDELIIQRHGRGEHRERIISLDDLLEPRMRQHAVPDQKAKSAVIEKLLVHSGNAVDDSGEAESVIGPAPLLAFERQSGSDGAIDIGDVERLDSAVGPTGAHEYAEIRRHLLLDIHADARTALVYAHRRYIGRPTGDLG